MRSLRRFPLQGKVLSSWGTFVCPRALPAGNVHLPVPLVSSFNNVRQNATTASSDPITPYEQFMELASQGSNLSSAVLHFEQHFKPDTMNFVTDYCQPKPQQAADYAMMLVKSFASLQRMEHARLVYLVALRDVPSLHAPFFDSYLQLLAGQTAFSRGEVCWVLREMARREIPWTEHTYAVLIEMHIRMGVEPQALWEELTRLSEIAATSPGTNDSDAEARTEEEGSPKDLALRRRNLEETAVQRIRASIQPSTALLTNMARGAVFHNKDTAYVLDVMRRLVRTTSVDYKLLLYVFQSLVHNPYASPDQALWLLFEVEQRCVFERFALKDIVYRAVLVELLVKCSKTGDHLTAGRLLALMERHLISRNADVYALMVSCYAMAEEVELAFDMLEEMHRKSFLGHTDPFKKFALESVSGQPERHYMMVLAETLSTPALVDRAYYHLEDRNKSGKTVSIHSLDVVVLACGKIGDEDRAAETVEAYRSFGLAPRTQTYNFLLLACSGRNKSRKHQDVYQAMVRAGVPPNGHTFRLLIRQALVCDDITEAISLLDKVTKTDGLRVEVEMILPILERSSRVGDYTMCLRMTNFALDHNIAIDPSILRNACQRLSQEFDCVVTELQAQIPLHEKLRQSTRRRK